MDNRVCRVVVNLEQVSPARKCEQVVDSGVPFAPVLLEEQRRNTSDMRGGHRCSRVLGVLAVVPVRSGDDIGSRCKDVYTRTLVGERRYVV